MAQDIQRSTGVSKKYKLDAGGVPVDPGPHIGIVKNSSDIIRTGKLLVFIDFLGGPDENDPSGWKSVSYISPFYGTTNSFPAPSSNSVGQFAQNKHSYGMWFTPPDIGTEVICFFINGDPNRGVYLGSKVNPDAHHMLPAIGSSADVDKGDSPYFANSSRLPVVEFNDNNPAFSESLKFFNSTKPIHEVQAYVLLQQGLLNDTTRGTIGSNSYRESPSTVFGLSTPGRPIFQGGYSSENIEALLNQDANNPGAVPPKSMEIVGREGGHSIVLDDGDLNGDDQLVRIRTAQGHQILLSDSGQSIHIIHANGQSWWELGSEGTVDMYASNSVNIRGGDINLHADRTVNINGQSVNINSASACKIEAKQLEITGNDSLTVYSDKYVGVKSDGSLSMQSKTGSWDAGSSMVLSAGCIDLNGGKAPSVPKTTPIPKQQWPDTTFVQNQGWVVEDAKIETVASRVPTHEPYPFHNLGTNKTTSFTPPVSNVNFSPNVTAKLDSVQNVEFSGLTVTDYEIAPEIDVAVGSIQPEQVKAMAAQASLNVPQDFNVISDDIGVGKYGLTPEELEKTGYLKPGTVDFFLEGATASASTVLQSGSVWSGKNGVGSVVDLLGDSQLQDTVKTELYTGALNELKSAGLATGNESPAQLAAVIEPASKYGADNVKKWVDNQPIDPSIQSAMDKQARSAEYSVEFADQKIQTQDKGFNQGNNVTNTVNRTEVDNNAKEVITTNKTTGPNYSKTTTVTESSGEVTTTTGGEVTTRTGTDTEEDLARLSERDRQAIAQFDAQRQAIQDQIDGVRAEIKAASVVYFEQNPGTSGRDWIRSDEFKALNRRLNALKTDYANVQLR